MTRTTPLLLCSALLCALTACGQDHHDNHDETKQMALSFMPMVGSQMFSCEETFTLGTADSSVAFTDFKLYLSEVTLLRADGSEVAAEIVDEDPWQHSGVALLDFEDGAGSCVNGNAPTRTFVRIAAPPHDDYTGVRATLGIPFELNHEDVSALPSPLNVQSMFWSWNGGRKFLRLDGRVDDMSGMRVHLGSMDCQGEQGDIKTCYKENRAQFELSGQDPTAHMIAVNVANLFDQLDLTPNGLSSVVCMSGPDTPSCDPIFTSLGASYASGDKAPDTQTFFTLTDTPSTLNLSKTSSSGDISGGGGGDHDHAGHGDRSGHDDHGG